MDAIELLKNDHDRVNELFTQFERGGNSQEFQDLFNQLFTALNAHSVIEEQIFYPAVRNHPDTSSLVQESYQEHAQVKDMLNQIAGLDNTSNEWGQNMTQLMHAVQHHVQEEEGELFPKVRQYMGSEQLQTLGQQMADLKQQTMSQMNQGASMAGSGMTGMGATGTTSQTTLDQNNLQTGGTLGNLDATRTDQTDTNQYPSL
ncbi:MAG TPA: hemerythrin domain-containing protein [Chloroflexia bacterium]|nr:hemerythrin domain-containing protein [Chloroflexia bacterium]